MPATENPERALRADAERNRLKILAAARKVFAERGLGASLDEVAADAGVGVGTVYRRFADKDALIDALFEERIAEVAQLGRQALAVEDPWEGFVAFMTEVNALRARDRGLKQALLLGGRERTQRARALITPIATELVERAQRAGALRDDLDVDDLPIIGLMVSAIADLTRDVSPEQWRRMLQLVLDGLAAERPAPTPLPGKGLDRPSLEAAIAERGCP